MVQGGWCTGNLGLIPGLGRSPGRGNGNPLQYSCLGNPMDRGACRATVHGVTKTWTRDSQESSPTPQFKSTQPKRASPRGEAGTSGFLSVSVRALHTILCEHPTDRGVWWAAVHLVSESRTPWLRLHAPNARGPRFDSWSGN